MTGIEERALVAAVLPQGRELRLALGMRGGVSLAVWIGGACAEIDVLRRARDAGGFWAPLLDAAGYGDVRVDVLAGASAGGLNGVLLAGTLLYGVPFARYRDIWLEVADLKSLLRDPGKRDPVSVLKGDEYFLSEMNQRLGQLVEEASAREQLGTDYLDLYLSATLLQPAAVPVLEDWGERYEEVSHRAAFRFRHNRFTSDFRQAGEPAAENAGAVYKLALAARSTSSFPGAFEPATIECERPTYVGERAHLTDQRNLFGLFSDPSRRRQRVIDGGVLDNIPLGKALDAIAASSADGPTERWLLYLHPSPEAVPEADESDATVDTLRTVLGTSTARGTAESVLDDIDALRAHNELAVRYRAIRRALLGMLLGRGPQRFLEAAAERGGDYWRLRAEGAARRFRGLLEDPVRVLGEDPFTREEERWPLTSARSEWGVGPRDNLEARIRNRLRTQTAEGDTVVPGTAAELSRLGAAPLARLAHVCLESVWRLEALGGDAAELALVKQRLYAVIDVASLLDHMGDLFWPVYAARRQPDPGSVDVWAAEALHAWERFLADPDTSPAEAPEVLEAFTVLRAELTRRLERLDGPVAAPLPGALWAELVSCVLALARVSVAASGKPEDEEAGQFTELLRYVAGAGDATTTSERGSQAEDRAATSERGSQADDRAATSERGSQAEDRAATSEHGSQAEDRAAQVLTAVEVLTFPLQALCQRPPQTIRYLRVAGSRRSPLERHFPGGRLSVRDKLAGNDLANFAAFYKRSWRANDWMWGRLDAAASLVDLVLQPQAVRAHFAPTAADASAAERASAFAELLRTHVCRPLEEPPDGSTEADLAAWTDYFASIWQEHAEAVAAEAEALFAGNDGTGLAAAREVLTIRRQWELLIGEIPSVVRAVVDDSLIEGEAPAAAGGRPRRLQERAREQLQREPLLRFLVADESAAQAPVRNPGQLEGFLANYRVGRERVVDEVGRPRFTALVADLAVVVWSAFMLGLGGAARPLRPVGALLRFIRRLALTTVRAPRWALVVLPVLFVLGIVAAVSPWTGRVPGTVVAIATGAVLLYWARWVRVVAALALTAAAVGAAAWLDASVRLALGPWGPWMLTPDGAQALAIVLIVSAVAWAPWLIRRLLRAVRRAAAGDFRDVRAGE